MIIENLRQEKDRRIARNVIYLSFGEAFQAAGLIFAGINLYQGDLKRAAYSLGLAAVAKIASITSAVYFAGETSKEISNLRERISKLEGDKK